MKNIIFLLLMLIVVNGLYAQTIQSKKHATIGYIKPNGTVQDKNHSTIGYAKGVDMYWIGVTFFFFDL